MFWETESIYDEKTRPLSSISSSESAEMHTRNRLVFATVAWPLVSSLRRRYWFGRATGAGPSLVSLSSFLTLYLSRLRQGQWRAALPVDCGDRSLGAVQSSAAARLCWTTTAHPQCILCGGCAGNKSTTQRIYKTYFVVFFLSCRWFASWSSPTAAFFAPLRDKASSCKKTPVFQKKRLASVGWPVP